MAAVLHFYSQFSQERPLKWTPPPSPSSPCCFGLGEPRAKRRREKLTHCCLVCSSVDEKKNRRSKDLKMTQRRNKPIATPRGKGCNERKISRHEERPAVPEENSTMKRTRGTTTRRHETYATKTTDNNLKNNFRSEEVFAGP